MPPRPSPSICSRCTYRAQPNRGFSNTPLRLAIPPESPSYIHVPEPVQPAPKVRAPIKGVLPIARAIFPEQKQYKATEDYIHSVTVAPKKSSRPHGPDADRIRWEKGMSDVRRKSLREGIEELWDRQMTTSEIRAKRGLATVKRNDELAYMPDPEDQQLTLPTLHNSVRTMITMRNAPGKQPRKDSKTGTHEKKKSLRRQEQLHELYVNAQHFIVTEKQLNDEIEKVFGSDDFPIRFNNGNSVWSLHGTPQTTKDMVAADRAGQNHVVDTGGQKRMKTIAEALTGGKMSDGQGARDWKANYDGR